MKKLIIAVLIIIIALAAWMLLRSDDVAAPTVDSSAEAITAELDGLNQADLDAELRDVDANLDQL